MIIDPLFARQERVARGRGEVGRAVEQPGDLVRLPLHRKGVKVVGDRLAQIEDLAVAVATRVAGAVQGAEHLVGQATYIFHDVNLTGLRPTDLVNVCAEHPERGPQTGAARHLDARLDPAVGNLESVLGQQPRRGVITRAVVALQRAVGRLRGDHQVAVAVSRRVGAAGGVVLQLVVAPAGDAGGGAVADLVPPDARVWRSARGAVELIAPHKLPLRRIGGSRLVVGEVHLDRSVAVPAVVPEAQLRCGAPILADREGAAKVIGDLRATGLGLLDRGVNSGNGTVLPEKGKIDAAPWSDPEHVLIGALAGQRQRIPGSNLLVGQRRRWAGRPEVREGLEIVEQRRVSHLVVADGHPGDRGEAHPQAAGRLGQLNQHAALALILRVVNRLDGERLLGHVGREGQRAGSREVIAFRDCGAECRRVIHRHRRRVGLAEFGGDRRRLALGDFVVERVEADRQRLDRRGAVDRHVVQVVALRAPCPQRAEPPAVHLGQAEAVIGRTVADLLAGHAGKRDLDQLPAGEVVLESDGPALGIVPGRAGVAIVEHVHEQVGAGARAVEVEGDAGVGAPVLGDPGRGPGVLKGVGDAGPRHDVEIQLQNVVPGALAWRRRRRRGVGGRDCSRAVRVGKGVEPDGDRAILPGRQPGLEIVHEGQRGDGSRSLPFWLRHSCLCLRRLEQERAAQQKTHDREQVENEKTRLHL